MPRWCEYCRMALVPGAVFPMASSGRTDFAYVERCDECARFETDDAAADLVRDALRRCPQRQRDEVQTMGLPPCVQGHVDVVSRCAHPAHAAKRVVLEARGRTADCDAVNESVELLRTVQRKPRLPAAVFSFLRGDDEPPSEAKPPNVRANHRLAQGVDRGLHHQQDQSAHQRLHP